MKKAQSAMEYLMTYGWAILIVIIVAAALFALGVFNPATYTGKRATGFPNMGVPSDWIYTTGGEFNITLRNGMGTTITITSVIAKCQTNQADVALNASGTIYSMGSGSALEFYTNATDCQTLTSGSSYSVPVTVSYTTQSGTYPASDSGTLSGAV